MENITQFSISLNLTISTKWPKCRKQPRSTYFHPQKFKCFRLHDEEAGKEIKFTRVTVSTVLLKLNTPYRY